MTSLSFPGNVSFGGTVSSPLFVSNQQIIAPFAAGTLSTLSVGSFASTYSNVIQAFAASLTIGTGTAGSFTSTYLNVSGSLTAAGNILNNVSGKSYLYNAGHISNAAGTVTDVGSGNVGMIFTYPAMLDLVNGSNTSMLRVSGNYVGINNTNPQYTLDVNGSARIGGAITSSSVTSTGSVYTSTIDGSSSTSSNMTYICPSNLSHVWSVGSGGNTILFNSGAGFYPSTDNNISLGSTGYRWKTLYTYGANIPGTNTINFGYDQTKETNAGKIGYQTFDSGCLNIVGAGTTGGLRTVKIYDNLIVSGGTVTAPNFSLPAASAFTGYTSQLNCNSSGNYASPYTFQSPSGNMSLTLQASGGGGYTNYINMYQYNGQGSPGAQIVAQDNGAGSANLLMFTSGTQRMTIASNGNVTVAGALSKGSGSFQIPHPLHQDKDLVHSFIEGPRCDLIYRGKVRLTKGTAQVVLDKSGTGMQQGTFEALCRDPDIFLQNNDTWERVKGKIDKGELTIECESQTSAARVSWMVIAERQDVTIKEWDKTDNDGRLILEHLKSSESQ